MMVEEFVPGRELTVAVMGGKALGVTEITTDLEFYDYEAKYATGGSIHMLPAKIPASVTEEAHAPAPNAHTPRSAAAACRAPISAMTTRRRQAPVGVCWRPTPSPA